MSVSLSQTEADALIALPKRPVEQDKQDFPGPGERLAIHLVSVDRLEDFILDVTRSRIDLVKVTYQTRGRAVIVLMRLDVKGPPHRNPDGESLPCPHLHIYREGFGDKWAFPVPPGFTNLNDMVETLTDFMTACNVVDQPSLQAGIF